MSSAGGAKCWGFNSDGQLGSGVAWRTTPVDVLMALFEGVASSARFLLNPLRGFG
ncbi:MAG: hypothetical protein KJZ86_08795 [Caldilineaceae bacterium]|nr:hypothetical protein [Caldilineaceae bacterium]